MSKTILITGASGMIGKSLTRHLLQKGHRVCHLNRSGSQKNPVIRTFKWDVEKQFIDERCIEGIDCIIHLAGEGIATRPWTRKRKQQIISSRTESIRLIYKLLGKRSHHITSVISASAMGYYGDRNNELLTEDSPPGKDFLGKTCVAWERAVDEGENLGLRLVKFRTGIVLTPEGGALPQLAKPVRLGFGAALGSGRQWMPWIHLQDVLRMYTFAVENDSLEGVYNMAAPLPVTNNEFTKILSSELKKPLWLPNVPAFVLRIILGEMSAAVLSSNKTSADKIQSGGFDFNFLTLREALKSIYG